MVAVHYIMHCFRAREKKQISWYISF